MFILEEVDKNVKYQQGSCLLDPRIYVIAYLFIHSFIYSFNKYIVNTYAVHGTKPYSTEYVMISRVSAFQKLKL